MGAWQRLGMTTRRRLVSGLVGALLVGGAGPAGASALPFLDAIYARYTGREAGGIALDGPAVVRRYFDPPLAALILADIARSARRDEPPALDGDPFVDAQDWRISDLRIEVTAAAGPHASASVWFRNFDKPYQLRLDLVRLASGWRIHEITYSQLTLTQILTAD